jgi:succinoglycan biosynthesis transport protein ExoP
MAIHNKKQDLIKQEFSPLSIARMLWKKRWVIVSAWVVLLAVTAVVVYKLPAVYTAEATVLVDSQKIPERYVSSTVNTDVGDRLATINQQIMSTDRLLKIIDTFDLYKDQKKSHSQEEIIEEMRKDISISIVKGWTGGRPGAFKIGYQGPAPTVVAGVANQLANLYVEENLKTRETQAEGTADFIDSQVAQAKKKLDELELQVSDFKRTHTGSLPEQENSLLTMVGNVQVQLQGIQDAINRSQQNKTLTETALSAAEATETLIARSVQQQAAQQRASGQAIQPGAPNYAAGSAPVKKRSEVLEDMLQQMKVRYGDAYPDVISLKAELARVKKIEEDAKKAETAKAPPTASPEPGKPETGKNPPSQVASTDTKPAEAVTRELLQARERIATLRTQLSNAQNDLKFQSAEQERLLKLVSSYQSRIDRLPLVEQQMASLTRDYENSKLNYKSLQEKKLSAGMATDMEHRQQAERFTIIDPARVPEKPSKPNRPLFGGIGAAIAIGLGLVIGFALEFRRNVLLGEWELPPDMVILGRIPVIKMPVAEKGWPNKSRIAAATAALLAVVGVGTAIFTWGRF